MDNTNANGIPTALRHLLSKGAMHTNPQIDGIVSQLHTEQISGYYNKNGQQPADTIMGGRASLEADPNASLTSNSSQATLKGSGSNAFGAWLSKYHLRPGNSRGSLNSNASTTTASSTMVLESMGAGDQTLAEGGPAFAAYITSVETREQSGGLRMGKKKHLVYKILVSGRTGQWWVARRYSEFYELFQVLRRRFPKKAGVWGDLFPKRMLPGLSASPDVVMQRREKLNTFLRSVTGDADVCPSEELQLFLHDISIDDTQRAAQQRMPLPDEWSIKANRTNTGRSSIERMVSMPTLKDSYMSSPTSPNGSLSRPAEQQDSAQPGNYPPLGIDNPKHPFATLMNDADAAQLLRKASDPQLYVSAEKRPGAEQSAVRKKYGLRRNIQYIDDAQTRVPSTAQMPDGNIELLGPRELAYAGLQAQNMVGSMQWAEHSDATDSDYAQYDGSDIEMDTTQDDTLTDVAARIASSGIARAEGAEQVHRERRLSGAMMTDNVNTLMGTIASANAEQDVKMAVDKPKKVGLDDFHLLSVIGKGSYGKVMLARYKDTGKVMAIKVISKSKLRGRPNEIRRVMSERRVLERTVQHPFLVGLQCAFQTKEKLYFCLDYVNGGELFFHLQRERRFAENRARFYAAEITSALAYLHGMDVVYRDLKPENCLLDARGHVRIVDFGLAKEVGPIVWRTEGSALYSVEEGGKTATFCGTPEYLAPEVLLRQSYGKEVDWYCLGAVLYEMLTGLPPYYDQDNNVMYRRILQEPLRFPTSLPPPLRGNGTYSSSSGNVPGESVGRLAQDFIYRILERDPKKRLGAGVFGTENVKRHAFFYGIDWGKIYRQEYAPPFMPNVSSIFDLSNIDPEFRNEPIPESILAEGQVDILAEAAEAERKAELEMQSKLAAFPQQTKQTANGMFDTSSQGQDDKVEYTKGMAKSADSTSDVAFSGFSFVSPLVDAADNE